MKFKCVCTTLFITLVVTLLVTLILGLLGVTTITLTSTTLLVAALLGIGLLTSLASFIWLIVRRCGSQCFIRCITSKLFLLFLFSVALIIFVLIGFLTFLATTTISLLVFTIGLFLLLGILFTELSILFPLFNSSDEQ